MGLPAITISQRRMVLATTGMRPTEKMTATAANNGVSESKRVSETKTDSAVSC
jgi:hypothetical protein